MALTQEQIKIMDNISGVGSSKTNNSTKPANNDLFAEMDKISGLGNTSNEPDLVEQIQKENPEKFTEWKNKGGITPYEAALNAAREFNGTYENVVPTSNRVTEFNAQMAEQRREREQKRAEKNKIRNQRVNEGTANFFERAGAYIDRKSQQIAQDQAEYYNSFAKEQPHKDNPNYRYDMVRTNSMGVPVYKETDLLKKIGFLEAMGDTVYKGTAFGAIDEGFTDKKEREIKQRILNNDPITQDELDFINKRVEREQEKLVRGYTGLGKVGSAVGYSIGFGADLLMGSALFRVLGLGSVGATAGKAIQGAAKGSKAGEVAGKVAEWGVNRLGETTLTTAITSPYRLFAGYQERMLNNEMKLTDSGNVVFSMSDEKPSTALFKSLGGLYISYLTEIAGGELLSVGFKPISAVAKGAADRVGGSLMRNLFTKYPAAKTFLEKSTEIFSKKFEELNKLPAIGKSRDWIKSQAHFDGFLEELGEEVLEDVLNLTVGTNNEERTLENYAKAIFKSPEEWAVLAGAIAIQGAGLSVMGAFVGNQLAEKGAAKEDIQDVLENATESQLRDIADDLIANDSIKIDGDIMADERQAIEDDFYNKVLEAGVSENVALSASKLMGVFKQNFGQNSNVFNKWYNKLRLAYNIPADNTANVLQNNQFQPSDRYDWDKYLRKVEITAIDGDLIELNNSIKVPKTIIAAEGASYKNQKVGATFWLDFKRRNLKNYNVDELNALPEQKTENKEVKEFNPEIENVAKKHFGTTKDLKEAGYILNDGSLLDLSGKNFGGVAGKRSLDHREIVDAFIDSGLEEYEDIGFDEFIDNGAIRFMPESDSFLIAKMPSEKQFAELKNIIERKNGEVYLELVNGIENWGNSDNSFSKGYEAFSNPEKIVEDIRTYFNGGTISPLKTYFQSAYHGTPHRFDKFSTEHIGSGEGAQAHGWGLYFAGDKEISENYRRNLSQVTYNYDGKDLSEYLSKHYGGKTQKYAVWLSEDKTDIESIRNDYNAEKKDLEYEKNLYDTDFRKEENRRLLGLEFDLQTDGLTESDLKEIGETRTSILEKLDLIADVLRHLGSKEYNVKMLNDRIKDIDNDLMFLENFDKNKLEKKGEGQLYKVEIPEVDEMLDEQEIFFEQPEKVQNAIKQIIINYDFTDEFNIATKSEYIENIKKLFGEKGAKIAENIIKAELNGNQELIYKAWDDWNNFEIEKNIDREKFDINSIYKVVRGADFTGRDFYRFLARYFNSEKEASEILNLYGIKGITYDGRSDGRCYVIFDENAVEIAKTYYQEEIENNENLIAGYTPVEVLDKLTEIYQQIGDYDEQGNTEMVDNLLAKSHILEDALESTSGTSELKNQNLQDLYLNVYYIMNNQELPKEILDFDKKSKRSLKDLVEIHKAKKEEAENRYYGYFTEKADENVITIMAKHDNSTLLHEMGHLFLNGLNELAVFDGNARVQLEAVNKWLGSTGEYTPAQHEKFARSFEAYLYKGKAPNNKLRQVFENFKEWLKAIYEHVANIPTAEISEEAQEIFDKMFGTDEYYEERKQANELLKDLKKLSAAEQKRHRKEEANRVDESKIELTPEQKRYKDMAYDILWAALSNSKKDHKPVIKDKRQLYMLLGNNKQMNKRNKGVMKQGEKLEEFLAELDDPFSAGDGFLPEWREFFTDTITEDSDDSALAQQAYNVITHNLYLKNDFDDKLSQREEFFEKAINDANVEYSALINKFKKGNRNVVLSAYYDWVDKLPELIKKDYEDRFTYDTAFIERNENLDKFEKAKREIIAKALELQSDFSINKNQAYKETVMEIMKQLNFLQPMDKAKLTANVLDIQTVGMLMAQIDSIMDIAKTMEDINYRRKLESDIHKELQTTKNVRKGARTVGKYDYKSNKIFEQLRELDRLSPEAANELRLEERKFITAEDNGLSYEEKLYNKFLSYKAGGRTFADTDLMKELYDEITKIKLIGKSAKSEQELQDNLNETKDVEELVNILNNKKQGGFAIKNYIDKVANLESCINAIFNKKIKEKYGSAILYDETQAQAWQYEQKKKFEEEVAKIYNLPTWLWDKKIIEYLSEKHTYNEIRRKYNSKGEIEKSKSIPRELTKMDLIQAYIGSKNEVINKRLVNQFGEDTLYSMFDELSLEDVKLAELLMNTATSFYPLVNKAYIRKYGLDLPRVSCYFPSTPERGSEVDLFNDYSAKSLNNGFTKSRSSSEIIPMDFHNPITTLYSHIDGVAKFVFMSENLDHANLVLKNQEFIKPLIINKYGEDVYRTLEQALMNVSYKKDAGVFNGYKKIIDNLIGNWIQANVAIKPIVGLKQLLSANNYAVDMPYMTWQIGFLKAIKNFKGTIDYMMKIPYLKARYGGSYSNEFLKQTIENSAFSATAKFKDVCNTFIKLGDIGAIIFGGKPYIDYLINEKGMTEEEAIKQFILSTNRSQQSSAISSLSNFQVDMTRNPLGKLFIAFKNSPQQYIRMCGDAIVSAANEDISKTQCAKLLFQFGYLQPFLYAMATSGSLLRYFFTGDGEDLLKDAKISIFNLGSDALPILGDIYKYALQKLMYKEKYTPQTTPLTGDIENEINRVSKEDVTLQDWLHAIGYVVGHVGMGINTGAIENAASGVGDTATGNLWQGLMKILGYTDKRAKNITEE